MEDKKVTVYLAIYVETLKDGQKTEVKITPDRPSCVVSVEDAIKFLQDYLAKQNNE